jgi:hypothetical protein
MEETQESTQILQGITAFTALPQGLILHPCIPHHRGHSALALLPPHVHILLHHIQVEEAAVAAAVAEDTDNRKWNWSFVKKRENHFRN